MSENAGPESPVAAAAAEAAAEAVTQTETAQETAEAHAEASQALDTANTAAGIAVEAAENADTALGVSQQSADVAIAAGELSAEAADGAATAQAQTTDLETRMREAFEGIHSKLDTVLDQTRKPEKEVVTPVTVTAPATANTQTGKPSDSRQRRHRFGR